LCTQNATLGRDVSGHRAVEAHSRLVFFTPNLPSLSSLQAVLQRSTPLPAGTPVIKGWDFNDGASLDGIMASMLTTGCQASALGQAVIEVNRMVR
jgi:hypothetical protein